MEKSARHKVILPALCWSRHHHDFYAVTDGIGLDGIRFRSATVPSVDDRLTCSIRHIGQLETTIVRTDVKAFVVRVSMSSQRSRAVARTLMEVSRRQEPALERPRVHPRIVPHQTDIVITLDDGSRMPSRLLNVSASGAAVHLDQPLEMGAKIRIGGTEAFVVRSFPQGAGVAFVAPLDEAAVNANLRL